MQLQKLRERLLLDFPEITDLLLKSFEDEMPVTIRLNPCKSISYFENLEVVPWAKNGRYLTHRPEFYLDPFWHSGAYYVQEASSMFLSSILEQLHLNKKPVKALDLCAAPGGKATLISAELHPDSIVIANETDSQRVSILKENAIRWGLPNLYVVHNHPSEFPQEPLFDFVLVDAPCSGEGMIRKKQSILKDWSEKFVQSCAVRQNHILESAHAIVKPGGFLIYSTCTFNRSENEWVLKEFLSKHKDFEIVKIQTPENVVVSKFENGEMYRFFPHLVKGEGFSVGILRKKGTFEEEPYPYRLKSEKHKTLFSVNDFVENPDVFSFSMKENYVFATPKPQYSFLEELSTSLRFVKKGIKIGEIKGKDFIPDHELALSTICKTSFPKIEVSFDEALEFLNKNSFVLNREKGIYLLNYQGVGIGFVKNIGNRWNSLLPNAWKIKSKIS